MTHDAPFVRYLADLNPPHTTTRRRIRPPLRALLVIAIAIVALAVGWLPRWILSHQPP